MFTSISELVSSRNRPVLRIESLNIENTAGGKKNMPQKLPWACQGEGYCQCRQ